MFIINCYLKRVHMFNMMKSLKEEIFNFHKVLLRLLRKKNRIKKKIKIKILFKHLLSK